ncbi:MAG: tRNA pseudouridine(55) synthase TruB [Clostridiales bacterium]|nr:tRNA pseudouridine(55) synthase TruB [Clostridiales bacterium]
MNGILPVNKPQGMTSHDVISFLRRLTGVRRIGHSGTLDPMATGVLAVYIGRATRLIEYAQAPDDPSAKAYRCHMRFGIETDTQDIWGETLRAAPLSAMPEESEIARTLAGFSGGIIQLPPAYSAVKIQGRKLYEYARKGTAPPEGAVRERRVSVNRIVLLSVNAAAREAVFEIECGKGVYVRTICADAGRLLGCGAVMSALVRTRSDGFSFEDCVSIERLEADPALLEAALFPPDYALGWMPRAELSAADAARFMNGITVVPEGDGSCGASRLREPQEPSPSGATVTAYCRVYTGEAFLGVGILKKGCLIPHKVYRED